MGVGSTTSSNGTESARYVILVTASPGCWPSSTALSLRSVTLTVLSHTGQSRDPFVPSVWGHVSRQRCRHHADSPIPRHPLQRRGSWEDSEELLHQGDERDIQLRTESPAAGRVRGMEGIVLCGAERVLRWCECSWVIRCESEQRECCCALQSLLQVLDWSNIFRIKSTLSPAYSLLLNSYRSLYLPLPRSTSTGWRTQDSSSTSDRTVPGLINYSSRKLPKIEDDYMNNHHFEHLTHFATALETQLNSIFIWQKLSVLS